VTKERGGEKKSIRWQLLRGEQLGAKRELAKAERKKKRYSGEGKPAKDGILNAPKGVEC